MVYKKKVKTNIDVIMTVWINGDVTGNKEIDNIKDINEWEMSE